MNRIYIASDHAGVELKSKILALLQLPAYSSRYEVEDLGPDSVHSVDYPDYADKVCHKIHGFSMISTEDTHPTFPSEVGILICGSGQGMNMRANKYPQIRAALCWEVEIARLAREHNDANVLCLGSRVTNHEICVKMVEEFLKTPFAGGRHRQRVVKVSTPVS